MTSQHQGHTIDLSRTVYGVSGLVALLVGVLILIFPGQSGLAVMQATALIIAAWLLISGVVYLGISIFGTTTPNKRRMVHALLGALSIIGGLIIIMNLKATAAVLAIMMALVVGILWIIEAVLTFTVAAKSAHKTWGIIYGVVGLIAGLVMVLSPVIGIVSLWWLLGIMLAVLGLVQVIRAFGMKSDENVTLSASI